MDIFQNGDIFHSKTGSFRKILKQQVEFVYVTAPHKVDPIPEGFEKGEVYQWWSTESNWLQATHFEGLETSIDFIKNVCKTQGPFDGILGFSQGGVMASILTTLQDSTQESPLHFKFAIIASAYPPHIPEFQTKLDQKVIEKTLVPTLHIYGSNDDLVLPEHSKKLATLFPDATTLEHEGGHYLPVTTIAKPILKNFVAKFVST